MTDTWANDLEKAHEKIFERAREIGDARAIIWLLLNMPATDTYRKMAQEFLDNTDPFKAGEE